MQDSQTHPGLKAVLAITATLWLGAAMVPATAESDPDRFQADNRFEAGGQASEPTEDGGHQLRYMLPGHASQLYPDADWLPEPYARHYPDLADTVQHFTEQSVERGGAAIKVVDVQASGSGILVTLAGPEEETLRRFAEAHQTFFDYEHAVQGKLGVQQCKHTPDCWDPEHSDDAAGEDPWAFFLPLGMPLIGQQAVTFLNYPPSDSLTGRDYLDNFTMKRWASVLESAGIDAPERFEAIVDARPIAAPGTGQAHLMPDIGRYFNNPDGPDYITPMLRLLADTDRHQGQRTLPVIVLGTPARKAWGGIIGDSGVAVLDVGQATLPGADRPTPWVASNHPDVTSYQCCANDPAEGCDDSCDLERDVRIDLQAACILENMAAHPDRSPENVKKECHREWVTDPDSANQRETCIRARLDYTWEVDGRRCESREKAQTFCSYYDDNPCPDEQHKCEVPDT